MAKIKHFKEPGRYFIDSICIIMLILLSVYLIASISLLSDAEIKEMYENEKITGTSRDKSVRSMIKLTVRMFGKSGLLAVSIIAFSGGVYNLYAQIAEYRRYRYKCRLYHEGLIKDINDIRDDYERKSIFKRIRDLFGKKDEIVKRKQPSKKEVNRIEREVRKLK